MQNAEGGHWGKGESIGHLWVYDARRFLFPYPLLYSCFQYALPYPRFLMSSVKKFRGCGAELQTQGSGGFRGSGAELHFQRIWGILNIYTVAEVMVQGFLLLDKAEVIRYLQMTVQVVTSQRNPNLRFIMANDSHWSSQDGCGIIICANEPLVS